MCREGIYNLFTQALLRKPVAFQQQDYSTVRAALWERDHFRSVYIPWMAL